MDIRVLASSSKGNAYTVASDGATLLLDAGVPAQDIRRKSGFAKLRGVFISHAHKDHSRAAADLMKQGLDVFASADTAKSCALTGHRLHTIEPFRSVRIDGFNVAPFDVQHDVPNLGFVLSAASGERLLYATDTYYVKYKFPALSYVMLECNFDGETLKRNVNDGRVPPELAKRLYKSHMSLETVVRTLSAWDLSKLRQVYLIHLSDGNSNAERIKRTIQAVTGAEVYVC